MSGRTVVEQPTFSSQAVALWQTDERVDNALRPIVSFFASAPLEVLMLGAVADTTQFVMDGVVVLVRYVLSPDETRVFLYGVACMQVAA